MKRVRTGGAIRAGFFSLAALGRRESRAEGAEREAMLAI